MLKCLDRVEYNASGTEVTLTKFRHRADERLSPGAVEDTGA